MIESASKMVITMRAPLLPRMRPTATTITTAPMRIEKIAVAMSWLAPPNCSTVEAMLVWNSRIVPPRMSSAPEIQVSTATSVTPPGRSTEFDIDDSPTSSAPPGRGAPGAMLALGALLGAGRRVEEGARRARPEQDEHDRGERDVRPLAHRVAHPRDREEQ